MIATNTDDGPRASAQRERAVSEAAARGLWSQAAAPASGLAGVVVVPVRNEAVLLPRALAALVAQRGVGTDGTNGFEVLVLANNCDDDTAAVARRVAASGSGCAIHVAEVKLPPAQANVGVARRLLMDEALNRLARSGNRSAHGGVIFSTDGDTRVEPGWVRATLAEIDAGADAVGGRILTEPEPGWTAPIGRMQRLDAAYRLLRARLESLVDPDAVDPWPRHHQHFGASLAVTADAYRRIGGLPMVPFLEDEALVTALRQHDLRIRHASSVRVWTSGRLDGRAEVGLSWQLGQWASQCARREEPWVIHPAIEARLWAVRREARSAWHRHRMRAGNAGHDAVDADAPQLPAIDAIASVLQLGLRWTRARFDVDQPFGRLWSEIETRWFERRRARPRQLRLRDAVLDLRQRVRALRAPP